MRYLLLTALLMVSGSVSAQGVLERLRNRLENTPLLDPVPRTPLINPQLEPINPGLETDRPLLGFQAEERSEDGVSSVYVENVQPDTAAEQAGLQPGDQIVKLAGEDVATITDITSIMAKQKVGDAIEVMVLRDGAPVVATATLTANTRILARPTLPGSTLAPNASVVPPPPAAMPVRQHGRLGVVVEDDPLSPTRGQARIANIVPNSAAAQAGLRVGDVISGLDGAAISGALDVQQRMRTTEPGQEVQVAIIREGEASQVTVRLQGSAPVLNALPMDAEKPPLTQVPEVAESPDQPASVESELKGLIRQLRKQVEQLEQRVDELEAE